MTVFDLLNRQPSATEMASQESVQPQMQQTQSPQSDSVFGLIDKMPAQSQPEQEIAPKASLNTAPNKTKLGQFIKSANQKGEFSKSFQTAARTGSRIAETALGTPAAMLEFPQDVVIWGAEKLAGKQIPAFRRAKVNPWEDIGLPSSREFRKASNYLTGGYTEPQTEGEATADAVVEDITALLMPTGNKIAPSGRIAQKLGSTGARLARAVGITAAGHGAAAGAKHLGGNEGTQQYAKTGAQILLSLANPKGATKLAEDLYQKSNRLLPQNAVTNTNILQTGINTLKRKLSRGEVTPSKKPILDTIEAMEKKIVNGQMPVRELQQFKKDIYEKIGNWEIDKKSHADLKRLAHFSDVQLRKYGKTQNPGWLNEWSDANSAFGANAEAARAKNYIKKYAIPEFKKNPVSSAVMHALDKVGLNPILSGWEAGKRIYESPVLRKYYAKTLTSAIQENLPATVKSLEQLNQQMLKDLEKNKEFDLSKYKKNL